MTQTWHSDIFRILYILYESIFFYVGNEYIHQLTNISGNRHLQIEVIRVNGQQVKVDYLFSTESEEDGYRLHVTNIGGITPSGKVKVVPRK